MDRLSKLIPMFHLIMKRFDSGFHIHVHEFSLHFLKTFWIHIICISSFFRQSLVLLYYISFLIQSVRQHTSVNCKNYCINCVSNELKFSYTWFEMRMSNAHDCHTVGTCMLHWLNISLRSSLHITTLDRSVKAFA